MTELLEKNERGGLEDEDDSRASSGRSRSSSLEPRPKRPRHDTSLSTSRNSFDDLEETHLRADFQNGTSERDIQAPSGSTRTPTPTTASSSSASIHGTGDTCENESPSGRLIVTTGQDVFMAPVEGESTVVNAATPAKPYDQYAREKREELIEDFKRRVPATNGKRTTFTTAAPPQQLNWGWNVSKLSSK
ncbi:hypothetical protein B0H13DRAFT_1853622 [Mycena leptocephala]|nr:hypothetical protein B0H13DRAFT_1853622 [Mycena leptocephala]